MIKQIVDQFESEIKSLEEPFDSGFHQTRDLILRLQRVIEIEREIRKVESIEQEQLSKENQMLKSEMSNMECTLQTKNHEIYILQQAILRIPVANEPGFNKENLCNE